VASIGEGGGGLGGVRGGRIGWLEFSGALRHPHHCALATAPTVLRQLAQHLFRASASSSPALVIVRGIKECTDDACFDALLSPLERYVDPNLRQPILGSVGSVRASVAAFVLVASHLDLERCEEIQHLTPVALQVRANAARRAFPPAPPLAPLASPCSTRLPVCRPCAAPRLRSAYSRPHGPAPCGQPI
jgi:hypothetical protein